MERLSDFKPLKRVVLPALGELNCAGLTVFVGPNSSGKTQLLRDIKGKLPRQIRDPLERLLTDLEIHGVYLVPYGELEDWLVDCGIDASKRKNKWVWANEAAQYIRENKPRQDDIWDFVRRLGRYLTAEVQ
jgi:predicted ATP-dependent endonuclease of OLD family